MAEVPVTNPTTGEIRMVPREGVQAFTEQTGWHVSTSEQREVAAENLESGSLGQQALAAGEQAVRTGTLGLAPGMEGWQQREKVLRRESPVVSGLAQGVGTIAPALVGGGLASGLATGLGLGAGVAGAAAVAGEGLAGGLSDEIETARYDTRDVSIGNVMLYGLGGEIVGRALPHAFSLGAGRIKRALTGAEAAAGEGLTDALVGTEERAVRSQAGLAHELPKGSPERLEALRETAPQQYDRMATEATDDLSTLAELTGKMSDTGSTKKLSNRLKDAVPESSPAQVEFFTGVKQSLGQLRDDLSAPLGGASPGAQKIRSRLADRQAAAGSVDLGGFEPKVAEKLSRADGKLQKALERHASDTESIASHETRLAEATAQHEALGKELDEMNRARDELAHDDLPDADQLAEHDARIAKKEAELSKAEKTVGKLDSVSSGAIAHDDFAGRAQGIYEDFVDSPTGRKNPEAVRALRQNIDREQARLVRGMTETDYQTMVGDAKILRGETLPSEGRHFHSAATGEAVSVDEALGAGAKARGAERGSADLGKGLGDLLSSPIGATTLGVGVTAGSQAAGLDQQASVGAGLGAAGLAMLLGGGRGGRAFRALKDHPALSSFGKRAEKIIDRTTKKLDRTLDTAESFIVARDAKKEMQSLSHELGRLQPEAGSVGAEVATAERATKPEGMHWVQTAPGESADEYFKRMEKLEGKPVAAAGKAEAEGTLEATALDYAHDAARRRIRGVADATANEELGALAGEVGERTAALQSLPDHVKLAINQRTGSAKLEDVTGWVKDREALKAGHGLTAKAPEFTALRDEMKTLLDETAKGLDDGLKDRSLFGAASDLEAELTGPFHEKVLPNLGDLAHDVKTHEGRLVPEYDPSRVRKFLKQDGIDRKLSQQKLERALEGAEEMAAAHERHGSWPAEDIKKLRDAVGRVRDQLSLADEIQTAKATPRAAAAGGGPSAGGGKPEPTLGQQAAQKVKGYAVSRAAGALGAAAGGVIGGPVGAALGWGVGEAASSVGQRLLGIDAAARNATKQAARNLAGVGLGYAQRVAGDVSRGKAGAALASGTMTALSRFTGDYSDPQASFEAKKKVLDQQATQPEVLYETLGNALGDLPKVHPELFMAIAQRTSQKVSFVRSNLPAGMRSSLTYPNGTPPSHSDLRDFATLWNTVMDPETVLHDINAGTATQQQMGILKKSDPELYDQLRGDIIEQIGANFRSVPTSTKASLDILLGADGLAGPLFSSAAARYIGDAKKAAAEQGQRTPPPPTSKAPPSATPAGLNAIQTSVTNRQAA